jgi:hypothetical protein
MKAKKQNANQPGLRPIAALCVSGRSIYKHLPGVDPFDAKRGAQNFDAKKPAIAHPPCRCWSKYLSHCAKPVDAEAEMELGRWCVRTIQKCGGVVEQPAGSKLWADMGLPMPNERADSFGGWTAYVEQSWFSYKSRKPTWLYIVGVTKVEVPPVPFSLVKPAPCQKPGLSSFGRSRTVTRFAVWLCQVARLARVPDSAASARGAQKAAPPGPLAKGDWKPF